MLPVDYLKTCKEAFLISWKNRFLWWFGFFIAIGSLGNVNYSTEKSSSSLMEERISFFQGHPFILITLIIAALLFLTLRVLGRGALIKSIEKIDKRQTTNFKVGLRDGRKYFWKLLGLRLLLTIYLITALIILGTPVAFLLTNGKYVSGSILAAIALIIFVPTVIVLLFLREFGSLYITLGNLGIFSSLEQSYSLFRKNLSKSLIMAAILMVLGFLALLVILIFLIPIALILFIPGAIAYFLAAKSIAYAIVGVGIVVSIFTFILIRSIWEVFSESSWILFFKQIASPEEKQPIEEVSKEMEKKEKIAPLPDPVKTIRTTK